MTNKSTEKKIQVDGVPFHYHQELELDIESLTNLGLGVAHHEGCVVMVPFVIPGERVRVRIYRIHARYAEADLLEVLSPSPHRVEAPCTVFGACGGCQYQMMDYALQLKWKAHHVKDCLERITGVAAYVKEAGVLENLVEEGLSEKEATQTDSGNNFEQTHPEAIGIEPTQACQETYHYRSKLTPHYQKTKTDGQLGPIGFLKAGQRRAIVDVPYCHVARPKLNRALTQLRASLKAQRPKRGGTLLLRENEGEVVTHPNELASEHCGKLRFQFKAGEFFQNNPYMLEAMTQYVCEEARGPSFLVDAYCGSGLFCLSLAHAFDACSGVEISAAAIEFAKKNARENGIENVHFVEGSAECIFGQIDYPGEESSVIIDPPRKGTDTLFLDQLFAFNPRRVVYVSCDPATQARDLKAFLSAGYRIHRVQPFDLFPQTRHIENVVSLRRD